MSAVPFMPFYVADYLADTTHLKRGEHGAYLLLLMAMWRANGRLPANDRKLALLALCTDQEWAEIRETILDFFTRRGGHLTHKRMTVELAKYANKVAKAKSAGLASAAKRANKNNAEPPTDVQRTLNQSEPELDLEPEKKERVAKATHTAAKAPKGGRIPADWKPSPEDIEFARSAGLTPSEIERESDGFRDYWLSRSRDAARASWSLTFRNRIRDLARRREELAFKSQPRNRGSEPVDFASIIARRRAGATN